MEISFKSDPIYFFAEKSNLKNNTVRIKSFFGHDERFCILDNARLEFLNYDKVDSLKIQIVNSKNLSESFLRDVVHVTKFPFLFFYIYIITWRV